MLWADAGVGVKDCMMHISRCKKSAGSSGGFSDGKRSSAGSFRVKPYTNFDIVGFRSSFKEEK